MFELPNMAWWLTTMLLDACRWDDRWPLVTVTLRHALGHAFTWFQMTRDGSQSPTIEPVMTRSTCSFCDCSVFESIKMRSCWCLSSFHFFVIYHTTFFFKPLDMSSTNRWRADGPDGSAFHEIIVLPTFAPDIARPQNLGPFQGGSQMTGRSSGGWISSTFEPGYWRLLDGTAAITPSATDEQVIVGVSFTSHLMFFLFIFHLTAPDREFFVSAVMSFTVPANGPRSRPKKDSETKNGPAVILTKTTRCGFLHVVLRLHDLHQTYQPSDISGFPFKLSWAGSPSVQLFLCRFSSYCKICLIVVGSQMRPQFVMIQSTLLWWNKSTGQRSQ